MPAPTTIYPIQVRSSGPEATVIKDITFGELVKIFGKEDALEIVEGLSELRHPVKKHLKFMAI